jgi:hypothetical protein
MKQVMSERRERTTGAERGAWAPASDGVGGAGAERGAWAPASDGVGGSGGAKPPGKK